MPEDATLANPAAEEAEVLLVAAGLAHDSHQALVALSAANVHALLAIAKELEWLRRGYSGPGRYGER